MSMDDMCREAAKLGIYGFDLVKPEDWPTLEEIWYCPDHDAAALWRYDSRWR